MRVRESEKSHNLEYSSAQDKDVTHPTPSLIREGGYKTLIPYCLYYDEEELLKFLYL